MLAMIEGEGRRLYNRGPGALGLAVHDDGVSLGGTEGIEAQMIRQTKMAGGHHVDWYFAEQPVAEYFRRRAREVGLSDISVYYVPAVMQ